jgi:hypothetical protein
MDHEKIVTWTELKAAVDKAVADAGKSSDTPISWIDISRPHALDIRVRSDGLVVQDGVSDG